MPRPEPGERWSRLRIAVFFAALVLPLAVMTVPSLRAWSGSRAATLPEWSWRVGALRRYPARFEEQFNAALPFREKAATLSRSLYVDLLGVSPVPEAVMGSDGWLYYTGATAEKLLDRHVRGRDPFSPAELELWRRTLLDRTHRFRSIGARYVFVVAPNKESIHPEHLPGWVGPKTGPTRLDQLMAGLKAIPELTVIDLRSSLIADKSLAPLYYKTDTHWNARGAYAAYRAIMRALEPAFPDLVTRSWGSFEPIPFERHGMDIARMVGLGGATSESDFELNRNACAERQALPIEIPAALQSRLTTPASFKTCDAPGVVDAVIFHDSFGVALIPFLAASFRSSANFSATSGPSDLAGYGVPEKLKANLVVEIMVERSLSARPPS